MIEVPYDRIPKESLASMVEEFVTRDGTDYGFDETSMTRKVENVLLQVKSGKVVILFDEESEQFNMALRRDVEDFLGRGNDS